MERVTQATFERRILKSEIPALVEFRTSTCSTCRALEPELERLAGDFQGRVRIAQVDVEADPGLGLAFRIRYVPTLGLFQNGRLTGFQVGVPSTSALASALKRVA
ncbi:MAG TPA: thioredoxin domain-containing protein [Planctomycetota bacterium]